jgi:hypothetical protein
MELPDALKPYAKAVAAFLVPFILAGIAWLTERAGVDVPVDPTLVETGVTAAVGAFFVWLLRNRQPAE